MPPTSTRPPAQPNRTPASHRMPIAYQAKDDSGQRRMVFDLAAIGMGVVAMDGRWISVNPALCELIGRTQEQLLGLSLGDVTHLDDVEADQDEIERLIAREVDTSEVVKRLLHASGAHVWVQQRLSVLCDNTGRPLHFIWQGRDITQHKRAEEAFEESEASFHALIERTPEMILVHRHGRLVYVNPAGAALLGYAEPSDLIGTSVDDLLHPDEHQAFVTRVRAMLVTGEPAPCREFHLICKGGRTLVLELTGVPIVFGGEPAVVSIARDLTERRLIQTRLLQTDRLIALGTLAGGVAHEINNPLTYVLANLDLVSGALRMRADEQRPQNPVLADQLDRLLAALRVAHDGAERVRRIVRDLTTFAQADEARRMVLDVRAVIEPMITFASNEISRRARLVRDFNDVPLVNAPEARLAQVFMNLLLNAAQAIPLGDADAQEIRVSTFTDASGRAVVEVRDSGTGISPEIEGRIFDPFFTTKPVGVGTGLGLSICHGTITALGGEITMEHALPRGTVFRVAIPAAHVSRRAFE